MKFPDIREQFEKSVIAYPGQVAIEAGENKLTYSFFNSEADKLAYCLIKAGLVKGGMAMLLLKDPVEVIISILAVMKAGGVFIPADPSFPVKRLESIAGEVQPAVVITSGNYEKVLNELTNVFNEAVPVITLEGEIASSEKIIFSGCCKNVQTFEKSVVTYTADDPCYIYFTSGSTGKPKGIVGRWESLCHFIHWETETFGVTSQTRVSQLTSITFDAFLRDVFVPLCSGGTLCIPDRDIVLQPDELIKWIDDQQINLIHCVPSLFRTFMNEPGGIQLKALKCILLSGEPVQPGDVAKWMNTFGEKVQLVNFYGPTETTMIKFAYFITPEDRLKRFIPVGKPIKGAAALVLDENGKSCPAGVMGEIYIRTPYRTLGYFKRPDLTKEVFIQNPFTDNPKDIIYKTGDLGRVMEDGNFEFAGRKDQQVKVRGIRIEPGEIESCLRSHQLVSEAVVIAKKDHEENNYLCAFLVVKEQAPGETFRNFLLEQLPEYMVPASFTIVDKMPLTASGKTDRSALASYKDLNRLANAATVAPRNETEARLVAIWKELLGNNEIGILDNFFEAGGHSLKATQVVSRIYKEFGIKIELKSLFRNPTVEALARLIAEGKKEHYESIFQIKDQEYYDVSHSQKRFWITEKFGESGHGNSRPCLLRIDGPLKKATLFEAIDECIGRHESLRTIIVEINGEPKQKILPAGSAGFTPQYVDLRQTTEKESLVKKALIEEAASPFNLDTGPLLRIKLFQTDEEQHYLILNMHHIINDGWSMQVLLREVMVIYHNNKEGKKQLKPLRIQYRDYAHWHNLLVKNSTGNKLRNYWIGKLQGYADPKILTYDVSAQGSLYQSQTLRFMLKEETVAELEKVSMKNEATLFMTLLTGIKILLFRYSGQKDIVIGSPAAGRVDEELENQIGSFLNVLPLRDEVQAEGTFLSLLSQVKTTTLDAFAHQLYPFNLIVEDLNIKRKKGKNPLFEVGFTFHNHIENDRTMHYGPVTLTEVRGSLETEHTNAATSLWIMARKDRGGVEMCMLYNKSLFRPETIEALSTDLQKILEYIIHNPETEVSQIPLAGASKATAGNIAIDLAL